MASIPSARRRALTFLGNPVETAINTCKASFHLTFPWIVGTAMINLGISQQARHRFFPAAIVSRHIETHDE